MKKPHLKLFSRNKQYFISKYLSIYSHIEEITKEKMGSSKFFDIVFSFSLLSLLVFLRMIFSKTTKLIFKNLFEFVFIAFIILTIVYFLLNSIPGATSLTNITNEQSKQEIMEKYHLSGPLIERYGYYLKNIFQGNLGVSTSFMPGAEINSFIWERFLTSMTVGSISLIITIFLGIPLGVFIGMSQSKIIESSSSFIISMLISIPTVIFVIFFLILGKTMGIPYIYSKNNFITWILPACSLGIVPSVYYIQYIKTEMITEINSMHAKFAAVKGISRLRFVWLHALRPSLFPVVTFIPFSFLTVFLGGLFTEKFFQIPGSGGLLLSSIQTKDINIVTFLVVLYALITVLGYNIRDILYKLIDPRVVK